MTRTEMSDGTDAGDGPDVHTKGARIRGPRRVRVVAAALLAGGSIAAFGASSMPTADADTISDRLCQGDLLGQNQAIESQNQNFKLTYQSDGNLVVYRHYFDGSWSPAWDTGTQVIISGSSVSGGRNNGDLYGPDDAELQYDGNFVVYGIKYPLIFNGPQQPPERRALFASGNRGAVLVMQNDGNVVLYATFSGSSCATALPQNAVWSTGIPPG